MVNVQVNTSERCPGVFFEYVSGRVRVVYQRRVVVGVRYHVGQPVPKVLGNELLQRAYSGASRGWILFEDLGKDCL